VLPYCPIIALSDCIRERAQGLRDLRAVNGSRLQLRMHRFSDEGASQV